MVHRFHTEFAQKYGVIEAIVLEHMIFWVQENEKNNREEAYRDGKWWTYTTTAKIAENFDYLSEKQVRRALESLEKAGGLIVKYYNQVKFVKTRWFALGDEVEACLMEWESRNAQTGKSKCPNGQIEMPKWANPSAQMGKSKCPNGQIKDNKKEYSNNKYNKTISNAREESITWAGEGITLFEQRFGFVNEKVGVAIKELAESCDWESFEKATGKAHKLFMQSKLPKGRVLGYVLSAAEGIAAGNDFDKTPKKKNDVFMAAQKLQKLEDGENDGNDGTEFSDSVWGVWGGSG